MLDFARMEKRLWIVLLLLVPVSASPLLPLGSGTLVRPLSFIPAMLLLGFAAFRLMFLRQRIPISVGALRPLCFFAVYVVIAGLVAIAFLPGEPFKGQTPLASFMRALATLGFGIAFYLAARLHIRSESDIRDALRWLFVGLSGSIALAVLQVTAIVRGGSILRWVQAITDLFALHYNGLINRAQGMAFEPSWLAGQIILLLLPPLVARIISRQTGPGAPARRRNIYPTLGGLAVALTGLLCAGSRFGIVAALLMLLLSGMIAVWRGRLAAAITVIAVLAVGGGGMVALASFGTGAGASYVLGPVGLLTSGAPPTDIDNGELATSVTDAFALAGRAAAGEAAFDIWRDHPLIGISLGNDYRLFGRYAPDWAFTTGLFAVQGSEGIAWLDPSAPEKANAKNLVLRLLSETGLIGFALFALFLWRDLFGARAADSYYAIFRLTTAAALLFVAINLDTFADPGMWIMLAICGTMGRLQALPRHEQPGLDGAAMAIPA